MASRIKRNTAVSGDVYKRQEKVLGHLGYNLGRWIYLADAYHDRQRDARKGAYNPFLCRYGKDAAEQSGGEIDVYKRQL